MALNIKDRRTDELARRAAALRETGITEAVRAALERDVIVLEQEREAKVARAMAYMNALHERLAIAPDRDKRPPREIRDQLNQDILDSHR